MADELREVTSSLVVDESMPPLIAIDQEGGVVTRLPWDDAATAQTLQSSPASDTRTAFDRRGELVAEVGVNVNFGVVGHVPADPGSFIAPRALGTDPASAAERVDRRRRWRGGARVLDSEALSGPRTGTG